MNSNSTTPRRRFIGQIATTAAAVGVAASMRPSEARASSSPDAWIAEVKGTHKCLFDFPRHNNAMPLLHILNYINTYAAAYKVDASEVGTVGTLYSAGNQASITMAFNDAIWAKYNLGAYTGLKDADGKPYTRNCLLYTSPSPRDS